MQNFYFTFKECIKGINLFTDKISPLCEKCGISGEEGIFLLTAFSDEKAVFIKSNSITDSLIKKDFLVMEEGKIKLSKKGAILAKSLSVTIERLKF